MRRDIQFLRGLAVLFVVLFHAKLGPFAGGYLGVDIFFVISGFLITGLIKNGIERGDFRFSEFYLRRAKRLLPAAYVTFAATFVLSRLFLTSQELSDLYAQLIGAATFTANIVLWRQGTYFGVDSELKPLLHTWSLSLEEQYYLIVPALLFFISRNLWVRVAAVGTALSVGICIAFNYFQPPAAFYLFPARAWELGIGSLGAFLYAPLAKMRMVKLLFWPSIFGVTALAIHPFGGMHPGIDSLLVCLFTLALILNNDQEKFSNPVSAVFGWVGDISYSLYLIHWPLLAIASNIWVVDEKLPLAIRITIVAVSVLLAFLQYRYVENPIRHADFKFNKRIVFGALGATVGIILVAAPISQASSMSERRFIEMRRGNTGFGSACTFNDKFVVLQACESSAHPNMLIWGDSIAMHLVPGINATKGDDNIIQATKYVCGPLVGVAPVGVFTSAYQNVRWAQSCLDFNQSVLRYLEAAPEIKTVVLSSFFSQFITPDRFALYDGEKEMRLDVAHTRAVAASALKKTVDSIRRLGKRVVIVAPPPVLDFDAGRCYERKTRKMFTLGESSNCDMPIEEIMQKRKAVYQFLDEFSRDNDVSIIRFDPVLLKQGEVIAGQGEENYFIANSHLSYRGSEILAEKLRLVHKIDELAR